MDPTIKLTNTVTILSLKYIFAEKTYFYRYTLYTVNNYFDVLLQILFENYRA
jgi:hypothetical protein